MASGDEELISLFTAVGIAEGKAKETLKNKVLSKTLHDLIVEAGVEKGADKSIGILLYNLATKPLDTDAQKHRPTFLKYIVDKKIKALNFPHAFAYLNKAGSADLNVEEFEKESGIGVEVTKEEVLAEVKRLIEENKDKLNKNALLSTLRTKLKFADPKLLNDVFNEEFKVASANAPAPAPAPKKVEKKEEDHITLSEAVHFPAPTENKQLKPEILENHLKATGGKIYTRFPPEPNGYLHLGHAKAMNLSFGYAKRMGGNCYLRFDDTNPEAESIEYIESIKDNVKWMGFEPWKITFASDYFQELYDFAVDLIKRGKAYVCHETKEQMAEGRDNCRESPWRNRPIEESLKLFEDMKKGKIEAGKAVLRMKGDMKSPNPCMRDMVAYRIKFVPHPHIGDKWCIYPSYDFTHCINDSLENITHSLCTLEFQIRRETYNWLLDALEIYRPPQIEYSRLNLTYTVLSKRKLIKLVDGGYVKGWDDPRMPTINGIRRRGYRPQALNNFCEIIGITRSKTTHDIGLLEHCCRQDLESYALRTMVVLHPLKVVLTNYPEGEVESITVPNHPTEKSRGERTATFSRVIYIERSDFREKDEADYFGLAPNKEVGLRYSYNIKCTAVIKNNEGEIVELHAEVDKTKANKPKGHIHWVAEPAPGKAPMNVEVRLFSNLFKSADPGSIVENWLDDLNPNSLEVIPGALADASLAVAKLGDHFQFERVGFFYVDPDTTPEKQVWNRTVTLKDTYAKIQQKKGKK